MALNDITVVDLTHVVSGPFATKILRDLGARVIKIENPVAGGDVTRHLLPKMKDSDWSAYFETVNGGKESITMRLHPKEKEAAEDRKLFEAMLERADVLVENFRPGVLEAWGYSWDSLHQRYPKLIMASISGFGQTGPYRSRKAVDTVVQGMSGFITCTGHADQAVKVGAVVSDLLAGVYCATGITTAIHARNVTGEGSRVDISMFDASFSFHAREFVAYQMEGKEPDRVGNSSGVGSYPFDVFECKNGKGIAVAAAQDTAFATFCETIGGSHLTQDPRYRTAPSRFQNREALREDILKCTANVDRDWLLAELGKLPNKRAFPFGPVNSFEDLQAEPQLMHRNMIEPRLNGTLNVVGNPVKLSSRALDKMKEGAIPDAPKLGQHAVALRQEFGSGVQSRL